MTVYAVTSTTADAFLQYGAVGAVAVVLGVFARTLIKREQDRADRLEQEVSRLNSILQEKVIPALTAATMAIQSSQSFLQTSRHHRDLGVDRSQREAWNRDQG